MKQLASFKWKVIKNCIVKVWKENIYIFLAQNQEDTALFVQFILKNQIHTAGGIGDLTD